MTVEATSRRRCISYHYTSAAGVPTALHSICTHITSRSGLHALLRVQVHSQQNGSHQMPCKHTQPRLGRLSFEHGPMPILRPTPTLFQR